MNFDLFQIHIDRLGGERVEKIVGPFDPSFLEVNEAELQFPYPVEVKGEAYLSEDHLVLHFDASTRAKMPCSVCNEMIETMVEVKNNYYTQPLSEIKGAVFNFQDTLREALLLELPHYIECQNGNCPERATLTPFLRAKQITKDDTYFPFSDL